MEEEEYLLTTIDNPFNPFDEFQSWYEFDELSGYKTCEKIASLFGKTQTKTLVEEEKVINQVIDEIISNDFLNIYKKVKKSDYDANGNLIINKN